MDRVACFLPCREGSERIAAKNIRPFGGKSFGLTEIKLAQLLACPEVDQIVLSTNDSSILEFASSLKSEKILLHERCEGLASSDTSTDELVAHVVDLVDTGHILWTHVTSPFISSADYSGLINSYFRELANGFDSLMTASALHAFLWKGGSPLNYDRSVEKWPRTQTIEPVYEVDSGAFISSVTNYKLLNDRVGNKPYIVDLGKLKSHDIDWPDDFVLAECMLNSGVVSL